jgi:hypothetical protein
VTTPQDPFARPPEDNGGGAPPPSTPPGWGAPGAGSGWASSGGHPRGSSNGIGTAALVVGVLALLSSWFFVGGLLGIVAIVLGAVGLGRVKKGTASNKGMAVVGIVLGALSILIAGALLALGVWIFGSDAGQELAECLEQAGADAAAQAECQREFENTLLE